MNADVAALLLPQGLASVEDLERDLSMIRLKLDNARNANHVRLIPQLVIKLEKREKLRRDIECQYITDDVYNTIPHFISRAFVISRPTPTL